MDKLIQPCPIDRKADGTFIHPDLPPFAESDAIQAWMTEQGLVAFVIVDLFDSLDDLPDEDNDRITLAWEQRSDLSEFPLIHPEGDGWFLLSIHDTEDGPVAWWVTRDPANIRQSLALGQIAPPRPTENEDMLRRAVGVVVAELFAQQPEQHAQRLQHILDLYTGHMPGWELATALVREKGWSITADMIDPLDGISSQLAALLHQAERNWVATYQITPDLAIGQRVRCKPDNQTGVIIATDHDQAGYYLVHGDDEPSPTTHLIVRYEDASPEVTP